MLPISGVLEVLSNSFVFVILCFNSTYSYIPLVSITTMLTALQDHGMPPRLVSGKDLKSDVEVKRAIQFAIAHKNLGIMDHGAIHYNFACSCLSIAWLAPLGVHPHARFICAAYAGYAFKLAKALQSWKNRDEGHLPR